MVKDMAIAGATDRENYPTLSRRFQALIVDQVFIILCMLVFSLLLEGTGNTGWLRGTLVLGLYLVYEPFCIGFGCTIGHYVTGIRVRKFGDEEKCVSLFNSYIRFIVKLFLGIISFFTVTSNNWKKGIHDLAAGSIVIYSIHHS